MDWNLAIERNRAALKRIVAMLAAMAGMGDAALTLPLWGGRREVSDCAAAPRDCGKRRPVLPRRLHRMVLRLLRPAESATRRLVVIMARGLAVTPKAHNQNAIARARLRRRAAPTLLLRRPGGTGIFVRPGVELPLPPPRKGEGDCETSTVPSPLWAGVRGGGTNARPPGFRLFDPPRRPFRLRRPVQSGVPRISFPGFAAPSPVALRRPPLPDDPLDATGIVLRLAALAAALDDLPRQARRLARWRSSRDAASAQDTNHDTVTTARSRTRNRFRRFSPLRSGRPPGWRRRPDHEVHHLLNDLHGLAFDVLQHPDTS